MDDYSRNKKERLFWGIVMVILAACICALESKADMKPNYNIAVKIDPAIIVYLNEKIEVYCEKDGQFYMTIELNESNRYEYKKVFENGEYTFRARVRYDTDGIYTVLPSSQAIELTYLNNNILNEIVFTIDGVSEEPEIHSHLADTEHGSEDDFNQAEKVYTIDDLDELYEMQESMLDEGEKAFSELEVWEQSQSFISKYETDKKDETEPMHFYPESEDDETVDINLMEGENLIASSSEIDEPEEEKDNGKSKGVFTILAILGGMLMLGAVVGIFLWRTTQDE